jgi:hypothetical protein
MVGRGRHFFVLAAADVGQEPDDTGFAVGPRLERPGPQAASKMCRQHRDPDLLDDVPDAINLLLLIHGADPLGC